VGWLHVSRGGKRSALCVTAIARNERSALLSKPTHPLHPAFRCAPQLTLLDGVAYKDKGGEGRLLTDDELRVCFRTANHKDEPLLAYKTAAGGGSQAAAKAVRHSVQLRLEGGAAPLPDLTVTDSSEALLQGRRPPFRLMVWCPDGVGGFNHTVQYAVSDDFVVATRRVKQANKADIPLVDDHVSKIEHIGARVLSGRGGWVGCGGLWALCAGGCGGGLD